MLKKFMLFVSIIWTLPLFSQDLQNLKTQQPFKLTGNALLSLNYFESSNASYSYQPFSYLMSVNLRPSIYGFSVPLSFSYSKMNKSFKHPFYRFGMSPSYKWVTLHLGHRSTNFSRFTMSGQRSLGMGIELMPGKFRFAFMYGKFKKDNAYKTIYDDHLNQDDYSLKGYAIKLGLGSKKNYFDLVFMHISDPKETFIDTSLYTHPESNVVASAISQFNITKHLKFNGEVAVSIFTHNMHASPYDIEDMPLFIHNMGNHFHINTSSAIAMATDLGLDYSQNKLSIGIQYQRIDPGYKSLGTHFIRNDFEKYSLKSGYRFKVANINGSIGLLRDNLMNSKLSQANRLAYTLGLSLTPPGIFSMNANYSNFSTKQKEGRAPLNDTIRLYQVNKNISIVPQLRFSNSSHSNIIMINYTYANLLDKNDFAENTMPIASNMAFLQYMYRSFENEYGISANINYTNFKTSTHKLINIGPSITADKTLLKKKGVVQASFTYLLSNNNSIKGNIITLRMGFNYKISKSQKVKLNYYFTKSRYPDDSSISGYHNSRGVLAYVYKF